MRLVQRLVAALRKNRRGVTALEYGLIAAMLGTAVITSSNGLGTSITSGFTSIGSALHTRAAGM